MLPYFRKWLHKLPPDSIVASFLANDFVFVFHHHEEAPNKTILKLCWNAL